MASKRKQINKYNCMPCIEETKHPDELTDEEREETRRLMLLVDPDLVAQREKRNAILV